MRREPLFALVLAVCPLFTMSARAAEPTVHRPRADDVLPLAAWSKTLDNGLEVIVVPAGFPDIVSVQIPVQTGSRNEVEEGKSGFAHLFEHLMFRGTPNVSAEEFEAIMARAGARRNAYTSDDLTNYHATFAKEDLEEILRIEADRFQHNTYGEAEFKTEAGAVLGEYNKNVANPVRKLFEAQRESAYRVHPYRHTTMGFLADIEDMPNEYAYSREFFRRWYRPQYTTVIVAGDVEPERVFALVEKHWGGWSPPAVEPIEIPEEPAPEGPVYAHVDWGSATLPYVAVAFHGPAFSTADKGRAALDMIATLYFGPTSDLYKRLVEDEQVVDQLFTSFPDRVDPSLNTVLARVKDPKDAVTVRDAILKTFARARAEAVDRQRLEDAKANARYGFARTLDSTAEIASILAAYVHFERSYETLNEVYRLYAALTPEDLQTAARTYFTDRRLVVTTLAEGSLPEGIATAPAIESLLPRPAAPAELPLLEQRSELPVVDLKLLFEVGSADDPPGKEGLAALAAAMITDAGSKALRIDEIKRELYPLAASFTAQVDKEMTTFTGIFHRDAWERFFDIALPMLLDPGFRQEDFERVKTNQLNALTQDLRSNNEEALSKEGLQWVLFAGGRYAHPPLGTEAGIAAITLDDVRAFVRDAYARGNLRVGLAGGYPDELAERLETALAALPAEPGAAVAGDRQIATRSPRGLEVTIVEKDTRATAITLGHPLPVLRDHPDFPALWLARAWLGEHRSSISHLYQRIREVRGMNYGDYAYIEAFPSGMFQFFPDPNMARRAQLFEIWIRPVDPGHAHMATRIALHELRQLIAQGLTQEQLDATREYLMKNVFVMTATQDQRLGYALDQQWWGLPEFTSWMRGELEKLTLEQVNGAMRRHLSGTDLALVYVTPDAEGLRDRLVSDAPSPMTYPTEKPPELLAEDEVIGAMKLGIEAEDVTIVPVERVFAGATGGE